MLPRNRQLSPLPKNHNGKSLVKVGDAPLTNRRPSASPQAKLRIDPDLPRPPQHLPVLARSPHSDAKRRKSFQVPSGSSLLTLAVPGRQASFILQVPSPVHKSRSSQSRRGHPDRSPSPELYPSKVARFACFSREGKIRSVPKLHNQDAFVAVGNLLGRPDAYLFGVFDGHGTYGHEVSQYLRDHMEECFTKSVKYPDMSNPELVIDALKEGFKVVNVGIRKGTVDFTHSGSTCVVVLVIGDVCICGNVGDSRAVLFRERANNWISIPLSRDHKPTDEDERARILERGGVIAQQTSSSGAVSGPMRVWLAGQQMPGLAMTRSMGDVVAAKIGVIGEPEVQQVMLTSEDQAIVLASDGLWEVMTNDEVSALVRTHIDNSPEFVAEKLQQEAQRKWEESSTTVDDTTVVYVRLVTAHSALL